MAVPYPETTVDILDGMHLSGGGRAKPFPFRSWAVAEGFDYPEGARLVLAHTQSAAEAFFVREFCRRDGCVFGPGAAATADGVTIIVQYSVGRYLTDCFVRRGSAVVAVEIDGMEFHHRSPERVAKDYARQRAIVALGFPVVRFLAFEALKQPAMCWDEVDEILAAWT